MMKNHENALARIKWVIKDKGKTQRELAEHLGRTPTYVTHALSNSGNLKFKEFIEIADWLNIDPKDLLK